MIIRPLEISDTRTVAKWIYDEWGKEEGLTIYNVMDSILLSRNAVGIPCFFVAEENGFLVGCASVLENDLPIQNTLGPWLANVYVLPNKRNTGLGKALIEHTTNYAFELVPTIYLYTHTPSLYLKQGWEVVKEEIYVGKDITIMKKDKIFP